MKILYKFTIDKLVEVEETINNEDGSKTIKKVLKDIPQEYAIIKPGLSLINDGDLYYHEKFNEFMRAGIMPEILLRKMFANENGVFAKVDQNEKAQLLTEWLDNTLKIKALEEKESLTDEEKTEISNLYLQDKNLKNQINLFDRFEQSIFDNSAESLARNKTVFWWLLNLLHKVDGDKFTPVFNGETLNDRMLVYEEVNDEIQDETKEGEFYSRLVTRASFLVSLFYVNGVVKPEHFAELVEKYDKEIENEKVSQNPNGLVLNVF